MTVQDGIGKADAKACSDELACSANLTFALISNGGQRTGFLSHSNGKRNYGDKKSGLSFPWKSVPQTGVVDIWRFSLE